MNDVGAHVVEEGLVVGDNEQSLLPVLQVVVQPINVRQINEYVNNADVCRINSRKISLWYRDKTFVKNALIKN
jgi:hypothetical protein